VGRGGGGALPAQTGHESSGFGQREVESFDPPESLLVSCDDSPARPTRRRNSFDELLWYSNVSRGKRRLREETAESACSPGEGHSPSIGAKKDQGLNARAFRRSWAQLIKRIYEIDPLVCPSCGGEMKVIAFNIDHAVVDKILRHMKRRAEKGKQRGPPGRSELAAVS
jgi:hypothetical protein